MFPRMHAGLVSQGVKAFRDLEYAKVDGQSLRLDLFVPENAKRKPPLLVWIHIIH